MKHVLMSIKPRFSRAIFAGTKLWELRRVRARIETGDVVVVYETAPTSAIVGAFRVSEVLHGTPAEVGALVEINALSDREYDEYFASARQATAIGVGVTVDLCSHEIPLHGHPPQSYRFLDSLADVFGSELAAEVSFILGAHKTNEGTND